MMRSMTAFGRAKETVNGKDISSTEFSSQELASGDTVVITLKDSSQAKG